MALITLFSVGLVSWLVATLTAGGAGIIYLALASLFLSVPLATITLGIAGGITGAYRVWIYRHDLSPKILSWLLPGTIIGAISGSSLFGLLIASEHLKALQIFLALFLIMSGVSGLFKWKIYGKDPQLFWFFPMGVFTGFVSGLIGAAGPMMNGLFQAFNLKPQQIVGTKSLNIFIQQIVKAIVYIFTILLSEHDSLMRAGLDLKVVFIYSCVAAAGGAIGVYLGRRILGHTRNEVFNLVLNIAMVFYGLHLAYVIY